MDQLIYQASRTGRLFHADNSRVRAIKGPVGSGKSSMCVMEILKRGMEQNAWNGVRKSRALVVRNTYAELKSTTIKTFLHWLGGLGQIVYDSPIRWSTKRALPDGTIMDLEVYFLPLDREEDAKKLRSLEITFAWLNEVSEIPLSILDTLRGRVGRFPAKTEGGASWRGIWMDTNPPSARSDFYHLFEEKRPPNHRIFHQPGGLIRDPNVEGGYLPNPEAENIAYLEGGYQYYIDQTHGASEDYIRTMVLGEYGSNYAGKAVYANQWSDSQHVARAPMSAARHSGIVVGLDFGLNPAAVVGQLTPTGMLVVLDEIAPQDITFEEFIVEHLIPLLNSKYPGYSVQCIGDPAGMSRNVITKQTVFQMLRERGLSAVPAFSNDFIPRRDAVAYFLTRRNGFLLNPTCKVLRDGFGGGYRYAKNRGTGSYKDKPEKGEHSHVHDALQYLCMYFQKQVVRSAKRNVHAGAGAPAQEHRFV